MGTSQEILRLAEILNGDWFRVQQTVQRDSRNRMRSSRSTKTSPGITSQPNEGLQFYRSLPLIGVIPWGTEINTCGGGCSGQYTVSHPTSVHLLAALLAILTGQTRGVKTPLYRCWGRAGIWDASRFHAWSMASVLLEGRCWGIQLLLLAVCHGTLSAPPMRFLPTQL